MGLRPHSKRYTMIKRDKNFKLPKQVKVQLAFMTKEKASEYRNLMVDAIVKGSVLIKTPKKKDHNERTTDSDS